MFSPHPLTLDQLNRVRKEGEDSHRLKPGDWAAYWCGFVYGACFGVVRSIVIVNLVLR